MPVLYYLKKTGYGKFLSRKQALFIHLAPYDEFQPLQLGTKMDSFRGQAIHTLII